MCRKHRRRGFTLRELLVVVGIISVLLALAFPMLQSARERARRNQCTNKVKLLGQGLEMHHEAHGRFPAVSNQGNPDGSANVGIMPGSGSSATSAGFLTDPGTASGYSWVVMILPYIDETLLFNTIKFASADFTKDGWSTNSAFTTSGCGAARHFSTIALDEIACPNYAGSWISTSCSGVSSIPAAVTAYSLPGTGYGTFNTPTASPPMGVVVTNYVALSATTSLNMPGGDIADGGIIPGAGTTLKSFQDGTSKTLVVCETKEPAFNAWYDGTTAWTTATPAGTVLTVDANGYLAVPSGVASSINYGPWRIPSNGAAQLYAPNSYTTAGFSGQSGSIAWGPSSDHAGGVVPHLAADGAVHLIAQDIDATLYVQLVTRNGREPVTVPAD